MVEKKKDFFFIKCQSENQHIEKQYIILDVRWYIVYKINNNENIHARLGIFTINLFHETF